MSYEENLEKVKKLLINFVKKEIVSRYNWNNEFHMWSYTAIKEAYISKFEEHLSKYMNKDIQGKLWFAGQNVAFAIQTYININPNYTLNNLLDFVEMFLKIQLDDFDNWSHEKEDIDED